MKCFFRRVVASIIALLAVPALSLALTVESKDLSPADGASGQALSTGSGVKTGHLQNGAVTPEKLSYAGVIFVHKGAGSPTIQGAIGAAAQAATASGRYLVKLLPGVYEEAVILSPYVDLEGSGTDTTAVTFSGGLPTLKTASEGTFNIRNLTVGNLGNAANIEVRGSAAAVVTNVKVLMLASDLYAEGIRLFSTSSLKLRSSEIVAEGGNGAKEGIRGSCSELLVSGSSIRFSAVGAAYALGIDVTPSRKAVIRDTQIEMTGEGTQIIDGVFVLGKAEIDNSLITVTTATDSGGVWGVDWVGDMQISNSRVNVSVATHSESGRSYGVSPSATNATGRIANSSITGSVTGVAVGGQLDITNSTVSGGVKALENANGGSYRIGASQIRGPYDIGPSDIRVNCFDSGFLPVP